MTAPITYPEHMQQLTIDINSADILKENLYASYIITMLIALMIVLVVVNCFQKYNERRILLVSLILNLLALLIFVDYNSIVQKDSTKYLVGFAMVSLTNLLIESSAITFIMKNLSHYVPANSYIMNSGFLLEFIELTSKFFTILLIMLGLYLN